MDLKNRVNLPCSNILQRAQFCVKKHLSASLPNALFHMCKNGQFNLNPLRSARRNIRRVVPMWKIAMILMTLNGGHLGCATYPISFDTIVSVSNMRYFDTQKIAFDHVMEERHINLTLHEDGEVALTCDIADGALQDLHRRWHAEDICVNVVEGENAIGVGGNQQPK